MLRWVATSPTWQVATWQVDLQRRIVGYEVGIRRELRASTRMTFGVVVGGSSETCPRTIAAQSRTAKL